MAYNSLGAMSRMYDGVAAPQDTLLVIEAVSGMTPAVAILFIEEFKLAAVHDTARRQAAATLALMAGGADAAVFLKELLTGSLLTSEERSNLYATLGGGSGTPIVLSRLPFDDDLRNLTHTLAGSGDADERRAAAGLLSGIASDDSRIALRSMMREDPDANVRASAIRSLGQIGDASDLHLLLNLWGRYDSTADESHVVFRAYRAAIERLSSVHR